MKKPRLRADWVVSIEVEELWIFESCRLSPIRINSVLEELRDKRLEVSQEVICVRAFWRCETKQLKRLNQNCAAVKFCDTSFET